MELGTIDEELVKKANPGTMQEEAELGTIEVELSFTYSDSIQREVLPKMVSGSFDLDHHCNSTWLVSLDLSKLDLLNISKP